MMFGCAGHKGAPVVYDRWYLWVVCVILLIHSLLLGWSATWQSPTLNEPGHLASGVVLWEQGRFDAYRVNPPLVRAVAALPVMLAGYKACWDRLTYGPATRSEFEIGADFMKANGLDSIRLFHLARWACIPFSVLGGWCCFLWGRALCCSASGLLSCVLWCFSPAILAAGQVIAPDLGGASLGLLASYAFWLWLKRLSWASASLAGATLGLAVLARSSWVILFGLWTALWLIFFTRHLRTRKAASGLKYQPVQLSVIFVLALEMLNAGYLFEGTFTPLGDFEFVSRRLGNPQPGQRTGNVFRTSCLAHLPVPLPKEFVLGIDQQKKDFEAFPFPSYLRGEWRETSWWYYYLYGFVVKLPLSILLLGMIAGCATAVGFQRGQLDGITGWAALCLPGFVTVVLLSCQPSLNHHFRYALPAFAPLFVFAGSIPFTVRNWGLRSRTIVLSMMAVCVVSLVCTTVVTAPRFQSFFNILAGGARNGHLHLIHSNLDWGQDLYFLKEWLREQKIEKPIQLAYHGYFDPADIGIDYVPATCGPRWTNLASPTQDISNLCVVSVNYLVGDRWYLSPDCDYRAFQNKKPIHICGDCLYVYALP